MRPTERDTKPATHASAATRKPMQPKASPAANSSLSTFKTRSISKHYAINNRILDAFDHLIQKKVYKGAYAFGLQFVEVALLEIPKHGYFYSDRHKRERIQNTADARRVIKQLELILKDHMKEGKQQDWDRIKKFSVLAEEQAAIEKKKKNEDYENNRLSLETELAKQMSLNYLCGDIMEYADIICPPDEKTLNATGMKKNGGGGMRLFSSNKKQTAPAKRSSSKDSLSHQSMTTADSGKHSGWHLSDDASYFDADNINGLSAASGISGTDDLQRALLLSGIATSENTNAGPPRRKRSVTAIDIMSLMLCYHEDFDTLRAGGRVRVSQAGTYQGRLNGSVNGCTLIAPLMCIHHFHNWDGDEPDLGLPDPAICEVIDKETPALLPEVRSNLGLTKDALIIPSDVHDVLIEKQLLAQEQFVTVCGGNILDDKHIGDFVEQLININGPNSKWKGRKIAATFFFHEHVVAILKLQRSESTVWFDLIDSLPKAETLRRDYEHIPDDLVLEENAARLRCTDVEALKATLRWYACSRFTDDNKQYIDKYDWDELYSDFDPRVFQAFIWAEMK